MGRLKFVWPRAMDQISRLVDAGIKPPSKVADPPKAVEASNEDAMFDREKFVEAEARAKGPVYCSGDDPEKDALPDSWWKTLWSTDPPLCPDCRKGRLAEGPSGGMSTNYICDYCQAKVNICPSLNCGHRTQYGWTKHLPKKETTLPKLSKPRLRSLWSRFVSRILRGAK